jgi:hypothetical protein
VIGCDKYEVKAVHHSTSYQVISPKSNLVVHGMMSDRMRRDHGEDTQYEKSPTRQADDTNR